MKYMKHYGEKFNMFKSIIKKNNPVIVEVGAHYGEDSMRFVETFPKCKIFCFEPDKRNIDIFKKYVNDKRVHLFEVALSNKSGIMPFYQSYQECGTQKVPDKYDWISRDEYINGGLNSSGASSLKKGYIHTLEKPTEVEVDRFDNWYSKNNIGKIDFAWIDVQGAEREVIEGMGNEIKNIQYIWMEYGEKFYDGAMNRNETLRLMLSRGFREVIQYSDHGAQGDILCVNTR